MCLLVDEGNGISTAWGRSFGLPAVAEKGRFNVNLTVSTLGGHSSVPPPHTGIGYMALALAEAERHPFEMTLKEHSPLWGYLQCAAEYAPDMPEGLKDAVSESRKSKKAFSSLKDVVIQYGLGMHGKMGPGNGDMTSTLMRTSQAEDVIWGGLKVNALVSSESPRLGPLLTRSPSWSPPSSTTESTSTNRLRS